VTGVGLGGWCGRNSAFGMKGNFGNAFAGNWDTPMKTAMANFRPFSTSGAFGMSGTLWNNSGNDVGNGGPGVAVGGTPLGGVGTSNASSFTRRQTNLWTYASPTLAGFQGSVAYSATNEATAQVNATTSKKPRLWGLGGTYTNGPLILGAGYERHTNYNPAAQANYTSGDDRAWNAAIAYTFMGTLKVSGIYTDTRYDTGPGTTMQAKSWGLFGDWAIAGPHRLRAGYSHLKDTSGNFGTAAAPITVGQWRANGGAGATGATLWSLQYAYNFSKRTELNFGYSRINNDTNSLIPLETLGGVNAGQDQSAWVFGVKHVF
jgi:predicted porin